MVSHDGETGTIQLCPGEKPEPLDEGRLGAGATPSRAHRSAEVF